MITLTGTFTRLDGTPASGTVRVTPSRSPIMDPDGGVIISGPQTFPLDAEGKISVTLPATNDPSLGEAFTYSVITNMSHANWQIRGLELPSSVSTVDLSNPPSGIVREYPTRAEWEAIIDPVVAGAEVAANRAEDAADSAWSAVDTPGRQGPPGEVTTAALTTALAGKVTGTGMTLRHDTTVGTRVLLDHPGGTTMLHGDTGWRNISVPTGITGATPGGTTPLRVRRIGDAVHVIIDRITFTDDYDSGTLSIPVGAGFAPRGAYLPHAGYPANNARGWTWNGNELIAYSGTAVNDARWQWTFVTGQPWPTTLPGLPV